MRLGGGTEPESIDEDENGVEAEGPDTEDEADLAEMAESGLVCSTCGVEFEQAHGHPVNCVVCWSKSSVVERKEVAKATHTERPQG